MKEELNGIIINHKPISESSLKRLILIFDHIYILEPSTNRFLIPETGIKIEVNKSIKMGMGKYGVLYNGENYEDEEYNLLDKFDYAINKGIIRILDLETRKFYDKHWLPLRISYELDSSNAEIMNSFIPLLIKNKNISKENGLIRGGGMKIGNIPVFPSTPPQIRFFEHEENKIYDLDHQLLSMAGKMNRGLVASNEYDLFPVFINKLLSKAFTVKSDIAKSNSEFKVQEEFLKQNMSTIEKAQFLLHRITEVILPDEIIEKVSIRELVIARQNSYEECIRLRRKLVSSINFLAKADFDDDFLSEVDKYISLEIEPLMNQYHKKFLETINQFLKYSLPFSSALVPTIIGIQQALNPMAIAYLSAFSATVGTATSELSQYVIKKKTRKFDNTFSYFFNFHD